MWCALVTTSIRNYVYSFSTYNFVDQELPRSTGAECRRNLEHSLPLAEPALVSLNSTERFEVPKRSFSANDLDSVNQTDGTLRSIKFIRVMMEKDVYNFLHVDCGDAFRLKESLTRRKLILMNTLGIKDYQGTMRNDTKELIQEWLLKLLGSVHCLREGLLIWAFLIIKFLSIECDRMSQICNARAYSRNQNRIEDRTVLRAVSVDKTFFFLKHFKVEWSCFKDEQDRCRMLLSFIGTFVDVLRLFKRHCLTRSVVVKIFAKRCVICVTHDDDEHFVRLYRESDLGVADTTSVRLAVPEGTRSFYRHETQFAECESVQTMCDYLYNDMFSVPFPFFEYNMQLRLCTVYCLLCVENAECVECLKCMDWVKIDTTTEVSTLTLADK
ncbi:hypothetical protein CYMTET_55158 [Cymbomonas tetramitiformis]|uniref:Uncharacterized protein n=1 Tax=Cymbomonas tetramitiformis TaxID=36881 RepID=A0AAE0ENV9_9CHLO|nr:hypothetical protein CYMTET_55158 [Cymbomonas tetramitiformis]